MKAQCPYFENSKGCSRWLHPKPYDPKRHLLTVHGVEATSQYDLKAKCDRVNKSKPTRPAFEPVTARELTDAFTRGVAVRAGCIANLLDTRAEATEAPASTSSTKVGSKRKRRGRHSKERVSEADTSQGNGSQRPEEKKAKVEQPTVERDTSSVDTPTETAESSAGFQDAPKRRRLVRPLAFVASLLVAHGRS